MKIFYRIVILLPLVLLSACETMNKYVIPPDWQSMDAFKASLKSKKVDTKPVFITDFRLEPSLKLLTESEIKKGKVSISNDAKLEITYKESYEYYYKQWSSNQYTPGYERYKRTTTPSIKQNPDELELNLLVKNDLQHSINSNDFSVALFINGEKRDIEIMNPTKIIPNTSETLIFKGPKYLELNPGDKISLRLFDVTTETNLAGAPSKKESFTWDMIYSTEKSTLEKPLYSTKDIVLIHYTDAQKAKIGFYTHGKNGKNEKLWDPKTGSWISGEQFSALARRARSSGYYVTEPSGTSSLKIGEKD